jgi:hypothetical protein
MLPITPPLLHAIEEAGDVVNDEERVRIRLQDVGFQGRDSQEGSGQRIIITITITAMTAMTASSSSVLGSRTGREIHPLPFIHVLFQL